MSTSHPDTPSGWIKPQRAPTLSELREQLASKRAEVQALERQVRDMEHEQRLQAVAQARNIMRAHGLTLADLTG
jgi:hypothetical protein